MKKKSKKTSLIILIIILIIVLAAIVILFSKPKKTKNTQAEETKTTQEETSGQISREGMMHSYLTGEWVDEGMGLKKPIAVMLNNIKAGVPQTGISRADIVYEAPVEGGICRLMGIFENYEDLDKIGSVRSARTYYVYLAQEYESVLVHFGEANYAESTLTNSKISSLSGTTGIGTTVFYRTTDRVSPHNAYASASGIAAGIKEMKYTDQLSSSYKSQFQFAGDGETSVLESGAGALRIVPGYSNNKPWFEYNSSDQLYYRFQFDGKQIDDMNNEQLAYRNIILEYCDYNYYDNTQYLNIDVNSGGTGKFITGGKAVDITWKKDSPFGQTHYFDQNGNEITLNQGKTWICIIQSDKIKNIQILDTLN